MANTRAALAITGERRCPATRLALLQRVSGEFQEMPGMRLTTAQARRLFGLRADVCQRILATLIRQGWLSCDGECFRYNDARNWPGVLAAAAAMHTPRAAQSAVLSSK